MIAHPSAMLLLATLAAAENTAAVPSACALEHKKEYAPPYGLDAKAWDAYCGKGLRPDDILALGRQWCRERYDAEEGASAGVGEADWGEACRRGLDGKAPHEYLRGKRFERLLKTPVDRMSVGDARFLAAQAEGDPRPEAASKKAEVQARLALVTAAQRKFSSALSASQWAQIPLSAVDGGSDERLRGLFDLARQGRAADTAGAVSGGGMKDLSAGKDERPLRPSANVGSIDKGIDSPDKRLGRLRDELASMRLQTERGRPLHDKRTIASLELMLVAADPKKGDPSLVILDDAERAFGAYRRDTTVVFKDYAKPYGSAECDGAGKCVVTIRARGDSGVPLTQEQIASTMMHEATHVDRARAGGGGNSLSDERAAHAAQYRLLSTLRARGEIDVAAAQRAFDAERPRLAPAEIAEREKRLVFQKLMHATMLDPDRRGYLDDFEKDPQEFTRGIVSRYYGEHDSVQPGAVTLEQERPAAERRLREASANEPLWRVKLGWESAELEAARKNVAALTVDAASEKLRLAADRRWRDGQFMACGKLIDADSGYRSATKEAEAALARLNDERIAPPERARLIARLEAAEARQTAIEESYGSCRVRR